MFSVALHISSFGVVYFFCFSTSNFFFFFFGSFFFFFTLLFGVTTTMSVIKTKPNPTITNARRIIILVTILLVLPFAGYYYLEHSTTSSVFIEEPVFQQVHVSIVSDGNKKIDLGIESLFDEIIPAEFKDRLGITTNIQNNIELFKLNSSVLEPSEIPYLINLDELYSTNNLNYVIFLPQNGLTIKDSTTNSFTVEGFGTIGILNDWSLQKKDLLPLLNIFKSNLIRTLKQSQSATPKGVSTEITSFTPMDHKLAVFLPILGPIGISILNGLANFSK